MFRAVLELHGKTATGFDVPPEVVEALGGGKRPAVTVRIGGHSWRSTIAPMGGIYMLGVSAENRGLAGVKAGEELDVEVTLDTEPREVVVPDDFAAAVGADPAARAFFDGLSYSNRRRLVLAIEGAKTAETRQRRIAGTVAKLRAGEI